MGQRDSADGSVVYTIATREESGEICTMLRAVDMAGWVRLAFARDPDPFAADFGLGAPHGFVLARDRASGALVGLCEVSVRDVWVEGSPRRLAYIGALRIAPSHRHRVAILRGGFARVGEFLVDAGLPRVAFTAISDDNHVARRLLTAGLPQMPTYIPVGGLVTLALATSSRHRIAPSISASPATGPVLDFLAGELRQSLLAPVWTPNWRSDTEAIRTSEPEMLVAYNGAGIAGTIAVWDQRRVRQTLVTGYAPWLANTRHLVNGLAPLLRLPRLPPAGSPLSQVYLSHFAVPGGDASTARALVEAGLALARSRGSDIALLGLPAGDTLVGAIRRRFGGLIYRSTLYVVHWPETTTDVHSLTAGRVSGDIAVL